MRGVMLTSKFARTLQFCALALMSTISTGSDNSIRSTCENFQLSLLEPELLDRNSFGAYCVLINEVDELRQLITAMYGTEAWAKNAYFDRETGLPDPRGVSYQHFHISVKLFADNVALLNSLGTMNPPEITPDFLEYAGDLTPTNNGWRLDFGSQIWTDVDLIKKYTSEVAGLKKQVRDGEVPAVVMIRFHNLFYRDFQI